MVALIPVDVEAANILYDGVTVTYPPPGSVFIVPPGGAPAPPGVVTEKSNGTSAGSATDKPVEATPAPAPAPQPQQGIWQRLWSNLLG
jgi:hypothetical protein